MTRWDNIDDCLGSESAVVINSISAGKSLTIYIGERSINTHADGDIDDSSPVALDLFLSFARHCSEAALFPLVYPTAQ